MPEQSSIENALIGLGALGSLAAGVAATIALVYAKGALAQARAQVQEVQKQIRESTTARIDEALLELDSKFSCILPTLTELEDSVKYKSRFAGALQKTYEGKAIDNAELAAMKKVDACLHFYFVLWARGRLLPKGDRLRELYTYYWNEAIAHKTHNEMLNYVRKYYTALVEWLPAPSPEQAVSSETDTSFASTAIDSEKN